MKINKNVLMGLGIAGGILLVGGIAHAEGLEEELIKYLNSDSFDLFGRKFDEILFRSIREASTKAKYSDEEIIAKLKFMIEDIKTLPLQAKCMAKIFDQNKNLYGALGGTAWLKWSLGPENFNKILLRALRVIFK